MRRFRGAPAAALVGLAFGVLTACGPAATTSPASVGTAAASPTPIASDAPTPPSDPTATPVATAGAEPPAVALEPLASGLERPINMEVDADGRIYVNEQVGRVMVVEPDGTLAEQPFLDIRERVGSGGERGLLGLALPADFPDGGRFFAHYTDLNGDTVLSEFGLAPLACPACGPLADPGSERVLLTLEQPAPNHNGGQLAIGPDGHLYMALGDGGGGNSEGSQDPSTLLGSILRLDVSTPGAYGIPADNPFADGAGGAPEVYVYGVRNPWRFSFDRATGDMWIGDVGAASREEVTRLTPDQAPGANLGWPVMEGATCFDAATCDAGGMVLPLVDYGRDVGLIVAGGYVYRGERIPTLRGWYVFADAGSGALMTVPAHAAQPAEGALLPRVLLQSGIGLVAFGEGPDGELVVADIRDGGIYRIVEAP